MSLKTLTTFLLALSAIQAVGQDRIELGYQTTRRGIVWYQSGKPTHQPTYRLSRDTNAVLWVDTLTALRYDWDYLNDRWRTKGTTKSALPPLPQQTSGSAVIDNTTALWIRDTFNILHKYDSTAQAWTPVGDFMYLSNVPTEINATGSNGAARYRRSLWQDADTYLVYYWDGSVWQQFGNASGGDNWGTQVAQVTARLTGDGTAGLPLDIAQQGATSGQVLKWNGSSWAPANDTDADLQKVDTFAIVSNTLRLSLERDAEPFKSVDLTPYLDNTDAQTLNSTGDATSHTAMLSNSGGSLKLKEGTNITLTTDATGLNGEVTISAAGSSDGNGIYGDGTAGSGNDALPPGGSVVTIPGQWQPLKFVIDNAATQVHTALKVTTDYCSDDAFTKYLIGASATDSLEIYNFDCEAWIKETGGRLNIVTDEEMYLTADSFLFTGVPPRTIGASMAAFDGTGHLRRISGTSSGQILQWDGTNWALAIPAASGLTGAENGLTVSGPNVRLGGTLITTTQINQSGFEMRYYGHKFSHMRHTFGYTPTQYFGISGYEGNPTTGSSPTADGIAEFVATSSGGSDQPNSLTIGALTTDNNGMWMQARSRVVPNFYYPLLMQPNGGRLAVGRSGTTASHFTVTASGLTGSTASGMVGLFENSGGSGNVSVGFGAGSDAVSGQLMWNGTNDAMRIINRNLTSGTSKISFAIGGETSDRAHLIYTSTSPNARFSVGQTAANTHSTLQSGGSIATAFRSVTAGTTLTEADRTVVYTLNSTVTFTLPSASGCAGREYIIHHFGSGGNISLSSSVISSTGTTFSAVGARQWAYIISDGSNWQGYLLTSL